MSSCLLISSIAKQCALSINDNSQYPCENHLQKMSMSQINDADIHCIGNQRLGLPSFLISHTAQLASFQYLYNYLVHIIEKGFDYITFSHFTLFNCLTGRSRQCWRCALGSAQTSSRSRLAFWSQHRNPQLVPVHPYRQI